VPRLLPILALPLLVDGVVTVTGRVLSILAGRKGEPAAHDRVSTRDVGQDTEASRGG
jgi:hypothetical protein